MKVTWKIKPRGGGEGYHMVCAARHLENYCNEAGHLLIQQCLIGKVQTELNMKKML